MVVILYFGIFLATTACAILLMQVITVKFEQIQLNSLIGNLNMNYQRNENPMLYLGGLGGFLVSLFLFWGSKKLLLTLLIGTVVGVAIVYFVQKLQAQQYKHRKQQEVMILFESIEVLMRAGLPLQKALLESKDLVQILRPVIERSMGYFPNTSLILENLRKEIDLPEGDILVSLLIQLNLAGIERFEGIIQRETQRLEEARAANEKIRTEKKPYWLVFSRILPLLVVFGMFIGALFMRLTTMFTIFN